MSSYGGRPPRQKRRSFGLSWWGNAWVEAVEQLSDLDQNRLPRGRTYARWGYVGTLNVEPGIVAARVQGSRPSPYHTHVKVKPFTDEQWEALFDVVASKIAHAAALLDGELTSDLVDDAAGVGINLLPAAGDISTGCTCPDDASPCKHAAAVCYLIADLLDDDPFTLLEMRGRTQKEVTAALRSRRRQTSSTVVVAAPNEEVVAKEVFAAQKRGPLPHVPKAPPKPGEPMAPPADMPMGSDVNPEDLAILAQATAQRAWEMCSGIGDSGLKDSTYRDLVRRLAPFVDTPEFEERCSRTRAIKSKIEEDARLWAAGGATALDEGESVWYPDDEALEPGIEALKQDGPVAVRNNRVTCQETGRQLRLGESERWYEYRKHGTHWKFHALAEFEIT